MHIRPIPLLMLALSLFAAATVASGQAVNRCIDGNGNSVFTDRPCGDLGVRERPGRGNAGTAPSGGTGWGTPAMAAGCAATPQELAIRLRIAAESGDLNQMAAIYHWPGSTRRSADSVLASLRHTLTRGVYAVDLEAEPPPVYAAAGLAGTGPLAGGNPTAVRLLHAPGGPDGQPPAATRFGLARNMGCWWIRW